MTIDTFVRQTKLLKKRSQTSDLLLRIAARMEETLTLFDRPGLVLRHGVEGTQVYVKESAQRWERQALFQLKQRHLLRARYMSGQLILSLTKKGENEVIRQRIITAPKKESGELCLITFDIPESQRTARAYLRCLLRGLGFERVHLSVWTTDKDVAKELVVLLKRIKKSHWVRIYTAKEEK